MSVIKINNLTKSYGKNRGVNKINLEVNEGEIFGFIGPNGAGKSTTIKVLLNLIYPTSGFASILGMDVTKESSKIKEYIGYVPSEVNFYDEVKVKDIIKYAASFYSKISNDDIQKICDELELDMEKKMGQLSLGNKKKVAIAQALIGKPKVLILDEPANGLDPLMQKKLFEILMREKKRGCSIFLSSHNLVEVENYCDRVAIIKEGQIVKVVDIKKLENNRGVKVTLEGENIDNINLKNITLTKKDKDKISFVFKGDINELVNTLSKTKLKSLLIEEMSLEDDFLSYYQDERIEEDEYI